MLIDGFNETCKNKTASYLKVGDESISVIRFRTTAKGNLTHLYYIFYNLDPLETEFNTVSCYSTGALLLIEVHIGKEGTKNSKY